MYSGLSFIVEFWSGVFGLLNKISLFGLLIKIKPLKSYRFVEYYVFLNTIAAVVALVVATWRRDEPVSMILLVATYYGIYRIYEIFVYQVNVLLFDEYRARKAGKDYAVRGYRRIVILLMHNYMEIVCWFGLAYMLFYRMGLVTLDEASAPPNFVRVFRESLLLMFSFNPEKYQTNTDFSAFIFSVQAVIGLFMTIMVLARFLSVLPPPATKDEFEQGNVADVLAESEKGLLYEAYLGALTELQLRQSRNRDELRNELVEIFGQKLDSMGVENAAKERLVRKANDLS